MSRFLPVLLFLFLPLSSYAQSANVFLGYSYLNAEAATRSNLNGWNASVEGKIVPWVGIVADLSGHYGKENFGTCGVDCFFKPTAHQTNFLFGPQVSVGVGKIHPFAHYLVGGSHITLSNDSGSDTSFAHAVGGGIDFKPFPILGWRVQGDFLQTRFFSGTQNNFRLSTGIVLHF